MKLKIVTCFVTFMMLWSQMVMGDEIVRISEVSGFVYDIESTQDGVWCATSNGIVFMDTSDRSMRTYTVSDGLPEGDITVIKVGLDNGVWAVADMTLYEKSGNTWHTVTEVPQGTVLDLERGGDGKVWAATSTGVYRLGCDGCRFWSSEDGLFADKSDRIVAGASGATWIVHRSIKSDNGLYSNGISHYDGTSWSESGNGQRGIGSLGAPDIAVSPDGSVLAYSSSKIHMPGRDGYTTYKSEDIGGGTIETLGFDSDGSVFVAFDGIIASYNGASWDVRRLDAIDDEVRVLAFESVSDTVLCACMETGVARFSDGAWVLSAMTDTIGAKQFTVFSSDPSGGLWAGSDTGLYHIMTTSAQSSISRHDSSRSPGDELGR